MTTQFLPPFKKLKRVSCLFIYVPFFQLNMQINQIRTPLASKDVNLHQAHSSGLLSPKKRLSPTKIVPKSPIKRQQRISPVKRQTLAFEIYQDNQEYEPKKLNFDLDQLDLNHDKENPANDRKYNDNTAFEDGEEDKENASPKRLSTREHRPLTDISIMQKPGYIQLNSDTGRVLNERIQLNEPWYSNQFSTSTKNWKQLNIPSYVTPPKLDRIKHYKYIGSIDEALRIEEDVVSESKDDSMILNVESAKKKLIFIHDDNIDNKTTV